MAAQPTPTPTAPAGQDKTAAEKTTAFGAGADLFCVDYGIDKRALYAEAGAADDDEFNRKALEAYRQYRMSADQAGAQA